MKTVVPVDIERARNVAVTAAEAAGVLLRESAAKNLRVRTKDASGDVVTELDLAAERLIVKHIRDAFPRHQIIAEESGLLSTDDSAFTWLVDPLDGTNNVVIGLNVFVVGIALCADKVPVLGVVHDPVTDHTWSAIRGGGTRGPLSTTSYEQHRSAPRGLVLAWTQGHKVGPADKTARAIRMVLESNARRVLQLWAPLLSWVMLARGDIDGFVGYRPEGIDLPAGSLISQEAGITVRDLDGSVFDDRIDTPEQARSFVAGRPEVIGNLLELVHDARNGSPSPDITG